MPGLVSSKDFTADDGERVAIIEFASTAELEAWRDHLEHRTAQNEGRHLYYEQYSLQVCELVRESRFTREPATTGLDTRDEPSDARAADAHSAVKAYAGGCFCGHIRYLIRGEASSATICHCSMCRRASGAPCVAWATFASPQIEWLAGTPREFASSDKAVRSFCGECGTALTFRLLENAAETDVTLGSLDRPELIFPRDHTYTAAQVAWLRLADGLPRFAEAADPGQNRNRP
jgi:hypothetical protein